MAAHSTFTRFFSPLQPADRSFLQPPHQLPQDSRLSLVWLALPGIRARKSRCRDDDAVSAQHLANENGRLLPIRATRYRRFPEALESPRLPSTNAPSAPRRSV